MKKALFCILALNLAAAPCYADIIPPQYEQEKSAEKDAVKNRMEDLGAGDRAANLRTRTLTPEELAYFAQDPNRIQAAGGLYWYEWILGGAMLAVTVGVTVFYFEEYHDLKS